VQCARCNGAICPSKLNKQVASACVHYSSSSSCEHAQDAFWRCISAVAAASGAAVGCKRVSRTCSCCAVLAAIRTKICEMQNYRLMIGVTFLLFDCLQSQLCHANVSRRCHWNHCSSRILGECLSHASAFVYAAYFYSSCVYKVAQANEHISSFAIVSSSTGSSGLLQER
jgi:hypothetical protein